MGGKLLSHARPNIGVNHVSARHRFQGVVEKLDLRARLSGASFCFIHKLGFRLEPGGRHHAHRSSELRACNHQRITHIVTIADIGKLQSLELAEFFAESKKVRQRLARMAKVGQAVDHRNRGVLRQLDHGGMREGARHDAVHPAFEISGDVLDGFALAQARLGMVKINREPAHA